MRWELVLASDWKLCCCSKNSSSDVRLNSAVLSAFLSVVSPAVRWRDSSNCCWLIIKGQFASSLLLVLSSILVWVVLLKRFLATQKVATFAMRQMRHTTVMQTAAITTKRPDPASSFFSGLQLDWPAMWYDQYCFLAGVDRSSTFSSPCMPQSFQYTILVERP